MARTRPLHEWETLDTDDARAGLHWIVPPGHALHRMTVVGRIVHDGEATGMFVVACECGDEFRMAQATIDRETTTPAPAAG